MGVADHANTVRKAHAQAMEALAADVHGYSGPAIRDWEKELDAALDALAAQAETAEAAYLSLDETTRYANRMVAERDTAVQARDHWIEQNKKQSRVIADLGLEHAAAVQAAEQARAALQQIADGFATDALATARAALAGNQPTDTPFRRPALQANERGLFDKGEIAGDHP